MLSAMLIPLYMRSPCDNICLVLATKLAAGKSYLHIKFVARLYCISMLGFCLCIFALPCVGRDQMPDNDFKHFSTNPDYYFD